MGPEDNPRDEEPIDREAYEEWEARMPNPSENIGGMDTMKQMLIEARQEILDLRRRCELLEAQVAIVDVFAAAHGLHRNDRLMTVDIAWSLQREIDRIESGLSQAPPTPPFEK